LYAAAWPRRGLLRGHAAAPGVKCAMSISLDVNNFKEQVMIPRLYAML
jgi:hypothetical protein